MTNVIYYKGKIGLEDVEFGRGTFLRVNSLGGIEELNQIRPTDVVDWYVDVRDYADIVTAINAIGSTYTSLLINDSLQNINSAITVPDNITLIITAGNKLTVSENVTLNCQMILHIGANIFTDTGKITTIKSSKNIMTTPYHQIFTGSGKVKFTQFSEVYPEWFGAEADGSTNDYSAFTNSLISGCTLNGGVRILINQQKMYVINNGASAGITIDADNLPDSTVTATTNEELPVFELVGYGNAGRMNQSGNAPSGGLKFTGTGNGIDILGTTRFFRGQIRLENLNILGGTSASRVAADGLTIGKISQKNVFRNLVISYFTGNGVYLTTGTANDNVFDNISSFYNDGWGWRLNCNEQVFFQCGGLRNTLGGVYFEVATAVQWIGGNISHNHYPQIKLGAIVSLKIDTYMEGQYDANIPYTPADGEGIGMIDLDDSVIDANIRVYTHHAGSTAAYKEQYIVEFDTGATVRGLDLDIMASSGFADADGHSMAIVGPIGAATVSMMSAKINKSSGNVDNFEDVATENAFHLIRDSVNDYTRTKTLSPFAMTFHRDNLTDGSGTLDLYLNGQTEAPNIECKFPYDVALVGMSINSNLSEGTFRVFDANSTLDDSLIYASHGTSVEYRYGLSKHTVNDGVVFAPKLRRVLTYNSGTRDMHATFFFAILNHDQDRDS